MRPITQEMKTSASPRAAVSARPPRTHSPAPRAPSPVNRKLLWAKDREIQRLRIFQPDLGFRGSAKAQGFPQGREGGWARDERSGEAGDVASAVTSVSLKRPESLLG